MFFGGCKRRMGGGAEVTRSLPVRRLARIMLDTGVADLNEAMVHFDAR